MSTRADPVAPVEPAGPDRAELWRWAWASVRPLLGWILTGAGLLCLLVSWYEVSGTAVVAKQLPYLVSGGLLGLGLITLGGRAFLIEDLRRDSGRLDRLEAMVAQLHAVLLDQVEPPAEPVEPAQPAQPNRSPAPPATPLAGDAQVCVTSAGTTFHRRGCVMLDGRPVRTIRCSTALRRQLSACPLCEPTG